MAQEIKLSNDAVWPEVKAGPFSSHLLSTNMHLAALIEVLSFHRSIKREERRNEEF